MQLVRGTGALAQGLGDTVVGARGPAAVMPERSLETLFDEMKRYVRFTDHDARHLLRLAPIVAPHFERIATEFYDRIREHESAHDVFTGEAQIQRLQRSLVRWMERLFQGRYDEAYFDERARIGRMHVKIGLPQRYMFTAMALIRASLEPLVDALAPDEAPAARSALGRMLDLELAIMLETYRNDMIARLRSVERQDREKLEQALQRSDRRYASAVELAHVLVIGLDASWRILLFNREAERVTGYGRDEVTGRDFMALLLPEGLHVTEGARLRAVAASGTEAPEAWEVPLRTRAGRLRKVHWQIARVPSSPDEDLLLLAIGQDVTEARALLERTVRSERLAAVGTLAAGLAHEIRNPLNGALLHVTYLERALQRAGSDTTNLEATRFIGMEIQRLSALVRDFLVFARPSTPQVVRSSMREVCERALQIARGDASRVRAELGVDFASTDLVFRFDPAKIEQVLLNLLRNAIDAVGSAGGGHVTLRTRREPRFAIVEVEDDGPGLPSPEAPIFDAFYSTKPTGTGLGLAITHRVVGDHGGTIGVDSRPGRTVFRVAIPFAIDSDEDVEAL